MINEREEYEKKLEMQLQKWDEQVAVLKAKADKAKADAKIECCAVADALQRKRDEAQKRLKALKASGEGEWEDLKAGAEEEWAEVTTALQRAISKF